MLLRRQTQFINDCIRHILDLYQANQHRYQPATSVILIGHSMGGVVARAVVTLHDYRPGSIRTIITLNTPHAYVSLSQSHVARLREALNDEARSLRCRMPPVPVTLSMQSFYWHVNEYWHTHVANAKSSNQQQQLADMVVISIAGSFRDTLIDSRLASLNGLISPARGITALTPAIDRVWLEADHQVRFQHVRQRDRWLLTTRE
jgi:GPI inositol-deacylase